jgi:hypothetical protein
VDKPRNTRWKTRKSSFFCVLPSLWIEIINARQIWFFCLDTAVCGVPASRGL